MKKNLIFNTCLILFTVLGLISCDNEPIDPALTGGGNEPGNTGNFQVDIDGVTFVATQAKVFTENGVTGIAGNDNTGTAIIITLSGSGVGTYNFGEGEFNSAGYTVPGETPYVLDVEVENPGGVEITEYDIVNGLASGTFEFVASHTLEDENGESVTESIEFTNGIFENITLETDEEAPIDEEFDFQVALNGDLFEGEQIADAVLNEDGLLISATQGNKQIGFQIYNPEVGTFNLGDTEESFVVYDADISDVESTLYYSSSGSLEITSIDMENGIVTGTFSGVLKDLFEEVEDIEMTEGVFNNISFSTDAPSDTGSAVIDGEDFNANVFPVVFVNDQTQISLDNDLDKVIRLRLPETITEGTFAVTSGETVADYSAVYEEGDVTYTSVADSGEIVISSYENDVVSGSFYFDVINDAGDTISILEGQFTVDVSF